MKKALLIGVFVYALNAYRNKNKTPNLQLENVGGSGGSGGGGSTVTGGNSGGSGNDGNATREGYFALNQYFQQYCPLYISKVWCKDGTGLFEDGVNKWTLQMATHCISYVIDNSPTTARIQVKHKASGTVYVEMVQDLTAYAADLFLPFYEGVPLNFGNNHPSNEYGLGLEHDSNLFLPCGGIFEITITRLNGNRIKAEMYTPNSTKPLQINRQDLLQESTFMQGNNHSITYEIDTDNFLNYTRDNRVIKVNCNKYAS